MKQQETSSQACSKTGIFTFIAAVMLVIGVFSPAVMRTSLSYAAEPDPMCENVTDRETYDSCCLGYSTVYTQSCNDYRVANIDKAPGNADKENVVPAKKAADSVAKGSLVPCTDECDLEDVFTLINNIIKFVLTVLLIPIFVLMIMYVGYQYLMAQGNPGMHAKLKSLLIKMVGGLALILCAWLIVRTLMATLGYTEGLLFFD